MSFVNPKRLNQHIDNAVDYVCNQHELTAKSIVENYFSAITNKEQRLHFIEQLRKQLIVIMQSDKFGDKHNRVYNTLIHLAKSWPINLIEAGKPICPIKHEAIIDENSVTLSNGYRYEVAVWASITNNEADPVTTRQLSYRDKVRIQRRLIEKGLKRKPVAYYDKQLGDYRHWIESAMCAVLVVCGASVVPLSLLMAPVAVLLLIDETGYPSFSFKLVNATNTNPNEPDEKCELLFASQLMSSQSLSTSNAVLFTKTQRKSGTKVTSNVLKEDRDNKHLRKQK